MMKNQPSPSAASTTPLATVANDGRDRDPWKTVYPTPGDQEQSLRFAREVRLLSQWLRLNRQAALVAAHGTLGGQLPEEEELLYLLHAVEQTIRERVIDGSNILDELGEWESSLLHYASTVAPVHCLVCRRAGDLPDTLRADYAWALQVVDGHTTQVALGVAR